MAIPKIRQEWPEVMSAQEVYDAAVAHIRAQEGEQAFEQRISSCFYRDSAGRACAVGALLTDAEASAIGPNQSMGVNWLRDNDLLPARLQPYALLLVRLQSAHDGNRAHVETLLRNIAEDRELIYTPPVAG